VTVWKSEPESGVQTSRYFNALNQTNEFIEQGSGSIHREYTRMYDGLGRLLSRAAGPMSERYGCQGLLPAEPVSGTQGKETVGYAYAYRGLWARPSCETPAQDGSMAGIAYGYDDRDRRDRLTYPSGRTVSYGYDSLNRVTSISQYGPPVAMVPPAVGYDPWEYLQTLVFNFGNALAQDTVSAIESAGQAPPATEQQMGSAQPNSPPAISDENYVANYEDFRGSMAAANTPNTVTSDTYQDFASSAQTGSISGPVSADTNQDSADTYQDLASSAQTGSQSGLITQAVVGPGGSQGLWGVASSILGPGASNADINALKNQLVNVNPGVTNTNLQLGDSLNLPTANTPTYSPGAQALDVQYQASQGAGQGSITQNSADFKMLENQQPVVSSDAYNDRTLVAQPSNEPNSFNPYGSSNLIVGDIDGSEDLQSILYKPNSEGSEEPEGAPPKISLAGTPTLVKPDFSDLPNFDFNNDGIPQMRSASDIDNFNEVLEQITAKEEAAEQFNDLGSSISRTIALRNTYIPLPGRIPDLPEAP
jgi:hypothetical protein